MRRGLASVFLLCLPLWVQAQKDTAEAIGGIDVLSVHADAIDLVASPASSDLPLVLSNGHGDTVQKLTVKVGESFSVGDGHHFSNAYRLTATNADTATLEQKWWAHFPGDKADRTSQSSFTIHAYDKTAQHADGAPAWPDTFTTRLEALALIQTLNTHILGSRSATKTLESWCKDHALASEPRVHARLIPGTDKPPTDEQRQRLQVGSEEVVKYRHVQLTCGSHVLSEADNWYVPSRLTPEMNQQLETTDTPFGKAVESLKPYRVTFGVKSLWSPLPEGWENKATPKHSTQGQVIDVPAALFEHDAVLYTGEHRAFSEVREVYQRDILAFPAPQ